jgi:hypothetical protein
LSNAQRDSLYTGIVPRSVIVKELKENGTYQFIDEDLITDLEEMEGLDAEGEGDDGDGETTPPKPKPKADGEEVQEDDSEESQGSE